MDWITESLDQLLSPLLASSPLTIGKQINWTTGTVLSDNNDGQVSLRIGKQINGGESATISTCLLSRNTGQSADLIMRQLPLVQELVDQKTVLHHLNNGLAKSNGSVAVWSPLVDQRIVQEPIYPFGVQVYWQGWTKLNKGQIVLVQIMEQLQTSLFEFIALKRRQKAWQDIESALVASLIQIMKMHDHGIVHNDLHHSNILFRSSDYDQLQVNVQLANKQTSRQSVWTVPLTGRLLPIVIDFETGFLETEGQVQAVSIESLVRNTRPDNALSDLVKFVSEAYNTLHQDFPDQPLLNVFRQLTECHAIQQEQQTNNVGLPQEIALLSDESGPAYRDYIDQEWTRSTNSTTASNAINLIDRQRDCSYQVNHKLQKKKNNKKQQSNNFDLDLDQLCKSTYYQYILSNVECSINQLIEYIDSHYGQNVKQDNRLDVLSFKPIQPISTSQWLSLRTDNQDLIDIWIQENWTS